MTRHVRNLALTSAVALALMAPMPVRADNEIAFDPVSGFSDGGGSASVGDIVRVDVSNHDPRFVWQLRVQYESPVQNSAATVLGRALNLALGPQGCHDQVGADR